MAVAAANLTSAYNGVDAVSFTTASVTPGSNRLCLLWVFNSRSAATAPVATVTGCSLTWTQEETQLNATSVRRITLFRALGASPTSGALTIDYGADTQEGCGWILDEFTGMDTSGTDGSGAIVQSVPSVATAATSHTITLAAFGSANNATYGGMVHQANEATTVPTGFTELADVNGSSPNTGLESAFLATNDTTIDWAWTSSVASYGIGVEIKAAVPSTGRSRGPLRVVRRRLVRPPARRPISVGV